MRASHFKLSKTLKITYPGDFCKKMHLHFWYSILNITLKPSIAHISQTTAQQHHSLQLETYQHVDVFPRWPGLKLPRGV
jgi:hypothetical protein